MKSYRNIQHLASAVSEPQKAVLRLAECTGTEIIRNLP